MIFKVEYESDAAQNLLKLTGAPTLVILVDEVGYVYDISLGSESLFDLYKASDSLKREVTAACRIYLEELPPKEQYRC